MFLANHDWPGSNTKCWKPNSENGKWRWILYDMDWAFMNPNRNFFERTIDLDWIYGNTEIMHGLVQNEEFTDLFKKSLIYHMNTTFTEERMLHVIDSVQAIIDPEMRRHIERWEDGHGWLWYETEIGLIKTPGIADYNEWLDNVEDLRTFARARHDIVIEQMQEFYSKPGEFSIDFQIEPAFAGVIHYDQFGLISEDMEWLDIGGDSITIEAIPKPGFTFSHWEKNGSNLSEPTITQIFSGSTVLKAVFTNTGETPVLVINEVMPRNYDFVADQSGAHRDWFELYNPGEESVLLNGMYFTDDFNEPMKHMISSEDPVPIIIGPGEYKIFWTDNLPIFGPDHLNFRLASDGEQVGLSWEIDDQIQWLDTMSFPALERNYSYGRTPDAGDKFAIFKYFPTPGSSNRLDPDPKDAPVVKINEIMAKNYETWENAHGQFEDWIELYNPGNEALELGGLYLSNNADNRLMHRIPVDENDYTQSPAGGHVIFIADGRRDLGSAHLNMRFRSAGGTVYLSYLLEDVLLVTIDSVTYPEAIEGSSYGRYPDGSDTWYEMNHYTPGNPNLRDPHPLDNIFINEFAAKNYGSWLNGKGQYEDWIEIYNANDQAVNLAGLFLTNDAILPYLWQIPYTYPDSTTVEAHSYLLFTADGAAIPSVRHTNFMLRSNGGFLALIETHDGAWHFIDSVSFQAQREGESYGRTSDGANTWQVFTVTTPGQANGSNTGIMAQKPDPFDLLIYPNPANHYINIQHTQQKPIKRIELINTMGQIILVKDLPDVTQGYQQNHRLDLPLHAKTGIYWVRLTFPDQIITQKILIDHHEPN